MRQNKVCIILNYTEHFIFASEITECVSVSDLAYLIGI